MKKHFVKTIILIVSLVTSCSFKETEMSDNNQSNIGTNNTPNEIIIYWRNYDRTLLYADTVLYGETPVYHGETPTKEDQEFEYIFDGWSPKPGPVYEKQTYFAQFKPIKTKSYTVTWKNWDGTILEVDENVLYGTIPTYDGETPTREKTAEFTYTFLDWTNEIGPVKDNIEYIARFNSTKNTYTVTWKNWDGTILEVDENVLYGTIPTYDGETPKRPSDSEYVYAFNAWNTTVSIVVSNATYIATYYSYKKYVSNGVEFIEFGHYPQSVVTDLNLYKELDKLFENTSDNYVEYLGNTYAKKIAIIPGKTNGTSDATIYFNGGSKIQQQKYYFLVEPITWRVLEHTDDKSVLITEKSIYSSLYTGYATTIKDAWKESDLRNYLNGSFLDEAFNNVEKKILEKTTISNSLESSGIEETINNYGLQSDPTTDYCYCLSYQEVQKYLNLTTLTTKSVQQTNYSQIFGLRYYYDNSVSNCPYYMSRSVTSSGTVRFYSGSSISCLCIKNIGSQGKIFNQWEAEQDDSVTSRYNLMPISPVINVSLIF